MEWEDCRTLKRHKSARWSEYTVINFETPESKRELKLWCDTGFSFHNLSSIHLPPIQIFHINISQFSKSSRFGSTKTHTNTQAFSNQSFFFFFYQSHCHCLHLGCSRGWCCFQRQQPPSCPCLHVGRPPPWHWVRCVRWSRQGRGRKTPVAIQKIPLSCSRKTQIHK